MLRSDAKVVPVEGAPAPATQPAKDEGKEVILDVLHFNDVYNLEPQFADEPVGGATRFMTVMDELKKSIVAEGGKPLVAFSGDFVGPSLMSTLSQGAHLIDAFNVLGVDFATFGNHELDYGYESLVNRLGGVDSDVQDDDIPFEDYPETKAQWIMTNMTETASGLPLGGKWAKKSALVDWTGAKGECVKVGIIGVSEDWLKGCSQLKPNEITYEDFIESARTNAKELKAQGADIVLALTHCRLKNDRILTDAVPEIDLLLGGHDHFYRRERGARIVKGGEEWRWLNHLQIVIDPVAKSVLRVYTERHDVYEDIPEHPEMVRVVQKYNNMAELKYSRVLCTTSVEMDPTEAFVRFKESAIANWCCDIFASDHSEAEGVQEADAVIIGGFVFAGKQAIPAGPFTLGNLFSVFPRPGTLVVLKLSGADIIRDLELGAKFLPQECGSLRHVSKRLKYTIVIPQDRVKYPTVKDVMFDDQPIDLTRMYSVGMPGSQAKGKYGFVWLKDAERIVDEESASQLQDIFRMHCRRHYGGGGGKEKIVAEAPSMGRITLEFEK
mmetsp:Transcript_14164/g.23565  ORF Transcript_14164/g.23565 Transcript_14164/m.23565 type:complete len:553 (-) Transcript_14164:267-1925(-)